MILTSVDKTDRFTDYAIQWRPTDMCNYDCSYCTPSNHLAINVDNYVDVRKLISAVDKIVAAIPSEKTLSIVISGGEPFLVPDFNLWLDRFSYHNIHVTVFTNGSIPFKFYEKCIPSLQNKSIKLSFHPESADIDKFVMLAKTLKNNNIAIEVRGMLIPTLFSRLDELELKLGAEGIVLNKMITFPLTNNKTLETNKPFSSSRNLINFSQRSDLGLDYYSLEERTIIEHFKTTQQIFNESDYLLFDISHDGITEKTDVISFIAKGLNKFEGWECWLPSRRICIQSNGDMQFGICGNDGTFGNIFTDPFFFSETTTICKRFDCKVPGEITIKKRKLIDVLS